MTVTTAAMPSLVPGDVVGGKYVLDSLLGRGGMGAVYAARQSNLNNRRVAIKVMLADPGNEEARQRFLNEGSSAATLRSEHVVQVYDLGSERGFEYMVLELLEGHDLAQQLEKSGPLQPALAINFAMQALRGLGEAHRHGIVHRDLKPSNLFLARRSDGTSVLKILDFGISKAQSVQSQLGQPAGQLTSTKAMLGSPLYMSPEQLRSSKSVDARADIWAMGVILYELATGKLPYMGESLGELFAAILENDAPSVRKLAPHVPQALDEIILKCLRKRPDERFQSSQELHDALAFALAGGGATVALSGYGALPRADRAMGSSPALPAVSAAMASTPATSGSPGISGMGSTTGSGANMAVVKGTVPLGAQTPGVGQASGTYDPPPSPPKGKGAAVWGAAIGGVLLVLALVGVVAGAKMVRKGDHEAPATGSSGLAAPLGASTLPTPVASATATTSASAPAEPAPVTAPVTPVIVTPVSANGGKPRPLTGTAATSPATKTTAVAKPAEPAEAPAPPQSPTVTAPVKPPPHGPEQLSR
jgi:serine/threonine protein kinase